MGRSGGACGLCKPVKKRHRGRQHRDNPVQWCNACKGGFCERHIGWVDGQWLCRRCERSGKAVVVDADG